MNNFIRNFTFFSICLFSLNANAYLAPLLGSAGAVAAFIAFIFALVASFLFVLWYHSRNLIKKISGKFTKQQSSEKK